MSTSTSNTNELRQRRGATTTPSKAPSPRLFYQESPLPAAKPKWNAGSETSNGSHDDNNTQHDDNNGAAGSAEDEDAGSSSSSQLHGTAAALSGEQVKRAESKLKKILVRVVFGACMFSIFAGSVSAQ